jgi:tRNA (uracil-5-)-methyltransferase TRM9
VNPNTVRKLIQLNHQFYQTFALQFSTTRQRLQPGVRKILEQGFQADPDALPRHADILELGCGNGELARELARRGHYGDYFGIDSNVKLLEEARQNLPDDFRGNLLQIDLASADWHQCIPNAPFDVVLAFAVLHHLPGEELRNQVMQKVRELIKPQGSFIHSEWQFLNSPRLQERIQPWERAGLNADEVDPGDYLLDWRSGGQGLRYAHHFSETELEDLAKSCGFQIIETFHSDGEGGKLGLYQLWTPLKLVEATG